MAFAASIIKGPWIIQWPPPDWTKEVDQERADQPQNGRDSGVEMLDDGHLGGEGEQRPESGQ